MTETTLFAGAALASAIAAIIAWIAKLRWSREYKAVIEQQLCAKDEVISLLEKRIATIQEMNPIAIREYYLSVKSQLEEYIKALQTKLDEKSLEVETNQADIQRLAAAGESHKEEVARLRVDRDQLQLELALLRAALDKVDRARDNAAPLLDAPDTATASLREAVEAITVGQRVEVTQGPFTGLRGTVTDHRRNRALITVKAIGASLELDIDSSQLQPLRPLE